MNGASCTTLGKLGSTAKQVGYGAGAKKGDGAMGKQRSIMEYERVYHPWCFKLDFDVAKFKAGLFPAVSISQLWYPRCIESYFDS